MSNHHNGSSCIKPCYETARSLNISYWLGLIATLILVFFSYFAVTEHHFQKTGILYFAIGVVAILHLVVQAIFYFRLNNSTNHDRWNLTIFLFSLLIMLIVISGSLWIMFELNSYMM